MFFYPKVKVKMEDIKPGDEYDGYEFIPVSGGSGSCFATIIIDENNNPLVFGKHPIELREGEVFLNFTRDMTWSEEQEWMYQNTDLENSANQLNLIGIHTDLYSVGDAYHEMWNGWVGTDWREQLMELKNEEFFIVGVAPAPYGCAAISNPVALVAEYKDTGARFWCHAAKHWIDDMREESKEQYMAYC